MYLKFCKFCGNKFFSKSERKRYCSPECGHKAAEKKREEMGQLCWRCGNACGGCSWSKNLIPVSGWVADPVTVRDEEGVFRSYRIKSCLEFTQG